MGPAVPSTLGRYRLEGELGRGMMGVVYRAHDPLLGRTVALKVVSLAFAAREEDALLFERRFLSEARAAASVSHPGIVTIHDAGTDPATGTLFIALEYLDGRTLSALAREGTRLPWREALRLTRQLARALHHAHTQGIVHRDVKPANIMIVGSGEPKIMDFGVAKVPTSQLTTAGELLGTPGYMSPEQVAAERVDGRSDLFSLGSVLYLLLTGRPAFEGASVPATLSQVCLAQPPPPSTRVPGLPHDVDRVVARALAKAAADRYPDGSSLAEDIEDVEAGRSPRHLRDGPGRTPAGPATRVPGGGAWRAALHVHLSRRALIAAAVTAGAVMVGFLARPLLVTFRGALPAGMPFAEPAKLEIVFEHRLKGGTLRVWVDDRLQVEEQLESRVTKKILSYRLREGTARMGIDVPPGEHVIRVQVDGDGVWKSQQIRGAFEAGATRRLVASLGLLKEFSVVWGN